jgi:hypothetical protein
MPILARKPHKNSSNRVNVLVPLVPDQLQVEDGVPPVVVRGSAFLKDAKKIEIFVYNLNILTIFVTFIEINIQ